MLNLNIEEIKFHKVFISFCLLSFLLLFASSFILLSDDIYYDTFGEQLSFERISEIVNLNNKWSWVIYIITPFLYLLKFYIVTILLLTGFFLLRLEVSQQSLIKIVLISEFVFLIPSLIKLLWFSLIQTDYTLINLQYFSPISALSLFKPKELEPWLIYPLQLLNVFELLYWCALAYQLKNLLERDFGGSLSFVAGTYGVGLLLWVIFVMFLTVSLT